MNSKTVLKKQKKCETLIKEILSTPKEKEKMILQKF